MKPPFAYEAQKADSHYLYYQQYLINLSARNGTRCKKKKRKSKKQKVETIQVTGRPAFLTRTVLSHFGN